MNTRTRMRVATGVAVLCVAFATAGAETSSTATGVSRLMNPAISVNALFLGQTSADVDEADANRIALQEAEMQLTSVVDPFWQADLIVAWHEEHADEEAEGHVHSHAPHFATDLEVAALRSRSMPAGLGLTLGKFYLPFGKHAPLHTHQFPFVSAPVAVQSFLGDHGLTDVGVSLDYLLPLPWYGEVVVYGVDGRAGIFNGEHRDLVLGGRLTNLWDLSDNGTLELGASFFTGPDANAGPDGVFHQNMTGVDLTYKWSSDARSHGASVSWTNEVILPDPDHGHGDPLGFYSHLKYRFHRNWWLGAGGGLAEDVLAHVVDYDPAGDPVDERHELHGWREYKANLVFAPSEFSSLRTEVAYRESMEGGDDDLRFSLQWNFTIGSHPAHMY